MKHQILKKEIEGLVAAARSRMSDADLGWLAGIIDGEGTITITPRLRKDARCRHDGWFVRLMVCNTDPRMIAKLQELGRIANSRVGSSRETRGNNRCKNMYHWAVGARQALVMLKVVRPFLVTKQSQADLAIELQERMSMGVGMDIHRNGERAYVIEGRTLSMEEYEVRKAIFLKIKELNRRGPARQEKILNDLGLN